MSSLRHRFGTIAFFVVFALSVAALFGLTFGQWRRLDAEALETGAVVGSYGEYLLDNWQWFAWPPLVLALGAYVVTRWLVHRSLGPIELIRQELESITSANLGRRVTVTETGDEVEYLGMTLNETLDRLESAVLANERLVADAAHELRTPLTAVRAALEVENTREPRELLGESITEMDRAGQLIDDLLLLARSPSTESRLELLDLDDIVAHEVHRLERQHPEIEIEHDIHPVQQRLAKEAVGSVVRNLLENAAKYGDGSIKVSLFQQNVNSYLVVEDNGDGIPVDQRDDVLQRFARLDRSRDRSTGGSGLGLAIVTETVEAHRGAIDISDSALGGCKMTVSFPLDPGATAAPVTRNQRTGGDAIDLLAANAPKRSRRPKVLAAAALLVAAVGVGGTYLWQQQSDNDGLIETLTAGVGASGQIDSDTVPDDDDPDSTETVPAAPSTSVPATTDSPATTVEAGPLDRSEWAVTASEYSERSGEIPELAIDGALDTRWTTGTDQSAGMWFEIDLGFEQSVSRLELDLENKSSDDYPRGYQVQVAADDGELGPVIARDPEVDGTSPTIIEFPQQPVRRIRILQTGLSEEFWWSISEINAYE